MRARETSGWKLARDVCLAQLTITALAALLVALEWGRAQALAAVYGGAVAWVPAAYMALRLFGGAGGGTAPEIVGAMFRGEIGKFALTVVMFAIGVKVFPGQFLALLVTYMCCLLAYWIVMARASFITRAD